MMRDILLGLCFTTLMWSCNNHQNGHEKNVKDSLVTYYLAKDGIFDTLSYSNVINSVKYIPLETQKDNLIDEILLGVVKCGNQYFIKSGIPNRTFRIKSYDTLGIFLKNIVTTGRGPNEILMFNDWSANLETKQLTIVGRDKVVILNTTTKQTKTFRKPFIDKLNSMVTDVVQMGNGDYVGIYHTPIFEEYDQNKIPFLIFMDSSFKVTKNIYYSQPRKIYQRPIPDISNPTDGWVLKSNGTDPIFIDVFNDTIYGVDNSLSIQPMYVLHRDDKNMPNVKNVNEKPSKVVEKIYYKGIIDAQDYICLATINGAKKSGLYIWHKSCETPICVNSTGRFPVSFDGFHGEIIAEQIIGNTIIATIPANKLMNVLPGLKEDDNPVVVEIKLKDNYTPAQ